MAIIFDDVIQERQIRFLKALVNGLGQHEAEDFLSIWKRTRLLEQRWRALRSGPGKRGRSDTREKVLGSCIQALRECTAFGPPVRLINLIDRATGVGLPQPTSIDGLLDRGDLDWEQLPAVEFEAKAWPKQLTAEELAVLLELNDTPISTRSLSDWKNEAGYKQAIQFKIVARISHQMNGAPNPEANSPD